LTGFFLPISTDFQLNRQIQQSEFLVQTEFENIDGNYVQCVQGFVATHVPKATTTLHRIFLRTLCAIMSTCIRETYDTPSADVTRKWHLLTLRGFVGMYKRDVGTPSNVTQIFLTCRMSTTIPASESDTAKLKGEIYFNFLSTLPPNYLPSKSPPSSEKKKRGYGWAISTYINPSPHRSQASTNHHLLLKPSAATGRHSLVHLPSSFSCAR
jgi:hypothetical protein